MTRCINKRLKLGIQPLRHCLRQNAFQNYQIEVRKPSSNFIDVGKVIIYKASIVYEVNF